MIKPTVGRVVWFYPAKRFVTDQPLAAIISAVWGDRCVNVMVIGSNGVPLSHPPTSVTLLQEGDTLPGEADGSVNVSTPYCRWMPYQVGQAKAQATAN